MSSNKIPETGDRVENFINAVDNGQKRKDSWDMIASDGNLRQNRNRSCLDE